MAMNDTRGKGFVRNRTLVILASAAVLAAAWAYAPFVDRGPVVCLSHGLVGIPCPGCGLTHAFCDLAHGRLSAAAAHNAVAFPLALLMLAAIPVAALELWRGRAFGFYRFLYSSRIAWAFACVMLAYHLWRVGSLCLSGRLVSDYLATSWTWPLWQRIFG